MGKETCIFNDLDEFKKFSDLVREKYGVIVQLAEIHGNRWSYVAGDTTGSIPVSLSERIRLNADMGVVIYGLQGFSREKKAGIRDLLEKLKPAGATVKKLSRERIIALLKTGDDQEIGELFQQADAVRKDHVGDEVHLRGIIELSNHCEKNCLYCGLRKDNSRLTRYRMRPEEIMDAARQAEKIGCRTVVLQSGEDRVYAIEELCSIVSDIKRKFDMAITLSLGELSFEGYRMLKSAGADRYLIKFETSDRVLYEKLKPDGNYDKRFEALEELGKLGYQTGAGIMTGLPGQSPESMVDDILMFDRLRLDMIANGPFVVNPQTPLKDSRSGDLLTALKVIALTRLASPKAHIPATTAMEAIHPEGRQKALTCGANVIMLNITPFKFKGHYLIYPGGASREKDAADGSVDVCQTLAGLNRPVSNGYGHGIRRKAQTQ